MSAGAQGRQARPACLGCGGDAPLETLLEDEYAFEAQGRPRVWRYRLDRCPECGLGRLDPLPDRDALNRLYAVEYGAYAPPPHRPWLRRAKIAVAQVAARGQWTGLPWPARLAARAAAGVVEVLGARTVPVTTSYPLALPRNAAILDYGCGWGWWLREVRRAGYRNLWGLDRDHPGLARLEAEGFKVVRGDHRSLPAATFECIRLEHVLEHILDPVELLRSLPRALKPAGLIVATVPDFASEGARRLGTNWPSLGLPHHVTHFTVGALRRVAEVAGLEVRRVQALPVWESSLPKHAPRLSWPARVAYHWRTRRQGRGDYLSVCLGPRASAATTRS